MSLAYTATIQAPRPIFKRQSRWRCVTRRTLVLSLLLIAAA